MTSHCHQEFYDQKWAQAFQQECIPVDEERAGIIIESMKRWATPGPAPQPKGFRILDVGCGVGWMARRLLPYGQVTGIDSSPAAIDIAHKVCSQGQFLCGDILEEDTLQALGDFDLVVCSEVFEHIPNDLKPAFAAALAHLVRPGGILLVTTPNRLAGKHYWRLPNNQKGRQPVEDWCTSAELCAFLRQAFRCLEIGTFQFHFSHRGIYRVLNSVKLNSLLQKLGLGKWFHQLKVNRFGLYVAAVFRRLHSE